MKLSHLLALVLFGVLSFAQRASAQITVTEPPDLSNAFPGTAYPLGAGVNTISGAVATPGDGQDNFQVTVPVGMTLTAVNLTLNTSSGFNGGVTWSTDVRMSSGAFAAGLPATAGTYPVLVFANFSVGNAWSMTFTVAAATPVCGNGVREGSEACDDGNTTQCDGCSNTCAVVLNGCFIGGTCIADGTVEPTNACRSCQRGVSRTAYSPRAAGTVCNDGLFCTAVDTCNGIGTCTGTTRSCSDGLSCTVDACDEAGDACVNPVTTGCLVGGACVSSGTVSPTNVCLACNPGVSNTTFSARPAGTACDDGQFCTAVDTCNAAGTCGGTTRDCSDTLSCTTDTCNETTNVCVNTLSGGCNIGGACIAAGTVSPTNPCLACNPATSTTTYTARPAGTACDDGQFCTAVDTCNAGGTCGGTTRDCSDTLSCTTDSCDEAADACAHPVTTGCLISGACVAADVTDPTNDCLACVPTASTTVYSPAASGLTCDDGAFCTVDDVCNGMGTCGGAARACTDDNACTTDACSETTDACTFDMIAGCMPDSGPALDGGVTDDAGSADAGAVTTDSGVASVDARGDAGPARDVGPVDAAGGGFDAGESPDTGLGGASGGSCGCRVGGSPTNTRAMMLLAAVALGLVARRRRVR